MSSVQQATPNTTAPAMLMGYCPSVVRASVPAIQRDGLGLDRFAAILGTSAWLKQSEEREHTGTSGVARAG